MKKKVLITGSNGLLGQKLVQLLSNNESYELIATSKGVNRLPQELDSYTYLSMDITNEEEVNEVIAKVKPEFIIHGAAMTNVDQCESDKENCKKQNVDAVKYIVSAAELINAHLIHLSTDFIFDGTSGPYDEKAKANPLSYYGQTKLDAEHIVQKGRAKWTIARTVLVYGIAHDMSRSNIILWVKKSLEDKKNIQVVNDQWRTPTLAEDLAMGCFRIMESRATGIYNISGKDFLTPLEMAIKTADFFKLDKSLITKADSSTFTQPAKRPPRTGFIIDKAQNDLAYNPHSFEEGLMIMAEQMGLEIVK